MSLTYHSRIDKLITDYKNDITLFMNSNQKLNEFISNINTLIVIYKGASIITDTIYFKKSYVSLFFPFQRYTRFSYTPYIGGLLLGNSSNCKFTIGTVNIDGNQFKLFNKIVDYSQQNIYGHQDLLIFDILSATIFDYILSLPEYSKYKDLIAKYRGSFLSYSHKDNNKDFWNFNNFINHTDSKSLYNPSNFDNIDINEKVIIASYDAIDNPITITEIFRKFESDNDSSLINDVLTNCCDIYNFLRDIGLHFGFMHNDLHMCNLLYNPTTKKIMIIDFGRASFAKFMVDDINDINKKIIVDFEKLNYNESSFINFSHFIQQGGTTSNETGTFESVQESFNIPEISETNDLFINFLYNSKDFFRKKYSPKAINGKYFGVIFDLITYSLNIYINLLFFIKKTYMDKDFKDFYNNFKEIIEIDFGNDITNLIKNNVVIKTKNSNEDELLDKYQKIKNDYIDKFGDTTKEKKIYTMLLEGLFYAGLLILFNRRIRKARFIYKYFQVLNTINELEQFKDYVINFINSGTNYEKLISDSFLSHFIIRRTGGVDISNSKSLSIPTMNYDKPLLLKTSTIPLNQTANAYIKIYEDYDKYRAPDDCDNLSIKKGGFTKRILKKYNNNR